MIPWFNNATFAITGVLVIGLTSVIVALNLMKGGFNLNNTRIFGIVLIASFTTVLALVSSSNADSAFSILGAIVGYLFGIKLDNQHSNNSDT